MSRAPYPGPVRLLSSSDKIGCSRKGGVLEGTTIQLPHSGPPEVSAFEGLGQAHPTLGSLVTQAPLLQVFLSAPCFSGGDGNGKGPKLGESPPTGIGAGARTLCGWQRIR